MTKSNLTNLQRWILCILEEAGEENVATLINTVIKVKGHYKEVEAICDALIGLLINKFIDVGFYDISMKETVPLEYINALSFLQGVKFKWLERDNLWSLKRQDDYDKLILVTNSGYELAHKIYMEQGGFSPEDAVDV